MTSYKQFFFLNNLFIHYFLLFIIPDNSGFNKGFAKYLFFWKKTTKYFLKFLFLFESTILALNNVK